MSDNNTIFAQATPAGRSGVAVMRISGSHALSSLEQLGVSPALKPRHAYYRTLINPKTGDVIDNALILFFNAPHSFTGEDVVEIQCHGSKAVLEELTSVLLSLKGIRYAEAGEFTKRAFFNGKMDYVQVEALHDLIESETPKQKNLALNNLNGSLSKEYNKLYNVLVEARAFCEVFLDFPDDDLPQDVFEQINNKIDMVAQGIVTLLASADYGRQLKEGIKVAIIGKPNSGKSTLLNALTNKDAAIVSDIPGTTRDIIEVSVDINEMIYNFIDTAGIRETDDAIELLGVGKAIKVGAAADIALILFDVNEGCDESIIKNIKAKNTIYVANKIDLATNYNVSRETICISAAKKIGLEKLKERLTDVLPDRHNEDYIVTRQRHIKHLQIALDNINNGIIEDDLVLKASYLIQASNELLSILGKIDFEDILDSLFSSFCIGK